MPFRRALERPGGTVNGPAFMAAADCAMWLAIKRHIGLEHDAVTSELNTAFLNAARRETVYCTARVLKLGKRIIYGTAECHDRRGKLFTHHTVTYVAHLSMTARRPPRADCATPCAASRASAWRRTPRAGTARSTFRARRSPALAAMGLCGVSIPEAQGGAGMDYTALALACEEISAGDGATCTIIMVTNLVANILQGYGNEAQKKEFLDAARAGKLLGAFCLTEPHAGSDAAAITTRAERAGAHYVLNGVKQFITSGKNADIAIVFAVTDKAAGKKGISAFVVPTSTPGYVVARIEDKTGQRASDTAQIVLENCKVPAANLLAHEGTGYRIALANLESGRINVAAQATGMAQAAPRAALAYAAQSDEHGQDPARAPGGQLPPRRHGHRRRGLAPAVPARRPAARRRHALPEGGLDGQAVRFRNRREGLLGRDPDPRRLRLRDRLSRSSASGATCACARSTRARATSSGS